MNPAIDHRRVLRHCCLSSRGEASPQHVLNSIPAHRAVVGVAIVGFLWQLQLVLFTGPLVRARHMWRQRSLRKSRKPAIQAAGITEIFVGAHA